LEDVLLLQGVVMLQVNLMGFFSVAVNGQRVHAELGQSGQRMAALLFSQPGRMRRREWIAESFWPGLDESKSRAALNSALWRLRRIISQEPESDGAKNLISVGDYVVFEDRPWLEIDAVEIRRAASLDGSGSKSDIEEVLRAIELYQGPFLEGEDSEFLTEERERLHSCFIELAQVALQHHVRNGAWKEAIVMCRNVLAQDPYREAFVRALVAILCLEDRRAEAIRYCEKWRRTLLADIGVGPMPRTQKMFDKIRACTTVEDLTDLEQLMVSCSHSSQLQM
jgi:DNA-binding SARP family transcriptional activator